MVRLTILLALGAVASLVPACGSSDLDACDRDGIHVVIEVPAGPCAPAGVASSSWSISGGLYDASYARTVELTQASALFVQEEDNPRHFVAQWAWPPGVTTTDSIGVFWQGWYSDTQRIATASVFSPATATGCQPITATAACSELEDAGP